MAVGTFTMFHNGLLNIAEGDILYDTNALKAALLTNVTAPVAATGTIWTGGLDATEIQTPADYEAGDYTAGGIAVPTPTLSIVAGTVMFDHADLSFGTDVTITAKWVVWYDTVTNNVIGFVDLNTDSGTATVSSTNSTFAVNLPAEGLYRITP